MAVSMCEPHEARISSYQLVAQPTDRTEQRVVNGDERGIECELCGKRIHGSSRKQQLIMNRAAGHAVSAASSSGSRQGNRDTLEPSAQQPQHNRQQA